MLTHRNTILAAICPLLLFGSGHAWSQVSLIDASFNNINDGLQENFSSLNNGVGNPTWNNANGEASMTVDEASSGAMGCVSDGSFDGSAYGKFTATFVIDGITDPDNGPTHNGHWVGIQGTNSQLWNNAEAAGGSDGWSVGVRFLGGNVTFVYDNAGGNEVTIGSLGSYTLASIQDGYTAEIVMDAFGWVVTLSGIDSSTGGSGAWPVGFDFSTIQADSSVFAAMTYQQAAEAGTVVDMTSVAVSAEATTPGSLSPITIFTTDAQTTAVTGSGNVASGDSPADSDIYIRERVSSTQTSQRISSFLNFDVSGLTVSDVSDPNFSATFTADYEFQLNNVNATAASVGRVTNGAWDGTTTQPQHSWGIDDAVDVTTLIADISALAPPSSVSADVTDIVKAWVNGSHSNYGLVVFIDELKSNGAGFSNVRLVLATTLDSDNDGMPDDYETVNGLNPNVDDAAGDNDAVGGADGLTNLEEYNAGTDPQDSDSDDDGLTDGAEVHGTFNPYQTAISGDPAATAPGLATDPLLADSDSDGLTDFEELDPANGSVTNPLTGDTDNDLLSDAFEVNGGIDPTDSSGANGGSGDPDMDGLANSGEQTAGTNPRDEDSDDDGLTDGAEVNTHATDPNHADSDRDGLLDAYEINTSTTDANDADSDDDFLNDRDELLVFKTDPKLADSDADTFNDGVELAALSNPNDQAVTPTGQDTDDDGLLDALEMSSFGNLDSSGLDDNDKDGSMNIVEQAFGTDLNAANSKPSLNIDSSLEITFRRHLNAGFGYELQVSEDLETWQSYWSYLSENAATPDGASYEIASFSINSGFNRLFTHVRPRTTITSRPNIILIYTDDQGYGDMGANNPNSKFSTPALDLLASQGVNFTDGHSADSVCTPSRYALLTGRYCWRTSLKEGVIGADEPALIPDNRMTLASLLRDHGYATAMVGKWHLGMDIPGTNGNRDFTKPIDDMPLDVGFDYFYGIPASLNFGYLAWIEGRFTAVNPTLFTSKKANSLPGVFNDYRITPPYDQSSGLEVAPDFDDVLCLTRFTDKAIEWMGKQANNAKGIKPFFLYLPLTSSHKPVIPREDFLGLSGAGAYGDFVMETDHHIGNILKFLDQSGLANNTMVIFTSDNGPETTYKNRVSTYGHDSAGVFREGKRFIYEGGHRVPFVVRWPAGIDAPGRVWDKPVGQTDLLATFAEMLGVTLDDNSGEDSVSFYSILRDNTANPTRLPMIQHDFDGRMAIRDGKWKLIMPFQGQPYELYNLDTDPTESSNVYATDPEGGVTPMMNAITAIVTEGRTTAGAAVGNDTGWWDHLEWIDPADY
ncbi:sulfatase-like hydrolase/transferase [Verrucomicrobiaceae bacterium 5K15]|uniref:Sulfatase-like hydrolase/transferase n=1 Tax=Oceaniferula flava TaxID=2800421 RepID=A0AAE2SCP6_9BACT|nr:sulfatase-like hydrolase/transferase [Oceaniferula flavus]MBK1854962.1 sulfatase-like hydrolase/transferase [Oceaniferula flavus]MBM1136268.1 sulfatase-like hydrolase/transferase [Oceaniferula flavus]